MDKKKLFTPIIFLCIIFAIFILCYKNIPLFSINLKTLSNNNTTINNYKTYYAAVKDGMLNYDSTLTLNIQNYDKNTYNLDVVKKILKDNPALQGNFTKYSMKVSHSLFFSKLTFTFAYNESKQTIQNKEKAIQNKVNEIVSKVTNKNMKDYEKEVALHDYIVNNTKYDSRLSTGNMPKESFTAYGVLIKGVGVCQGYTEAMDRLLKACGIESTMVTGYANNGTGWIGHAWNIVKIGGKYYHLDTTWDDPIMSDGSNRIRYSYFNITDEQISKNHKWDKNNYPTCNSTDYAFENLNVTEKDSKGNTTTITKSYTEFNSAVKKALINKAASASFKIKDYDNNVDNIKYWIEKAYRDLSKYGSYKFTYYKDDIHQWVYVNIDFK